MLCSRWSQKAPKTLRGTPSRFILITHSRIQTVCPTVDVVSALYYHTRPPALKQSSSLQLGPILMTMGPECCGLRPGVARHFVQSQGSTRHFVLAMPHQLLLLLTAAAIIFDASTAHKTVILSAPGSGFVCKIVSLRVLPSVLCLTACPLSVCLVGFMIECS